MGAEDAEWFLNNGEIKNGIVKIKEYSGKNPSNGTTESAVVEDEQYLFVSYFKGSVYRYDKTNDKHAVIYAPEFQYDWVDSLKWDGQRLTIGLRDNAGVFEFENATNILRMTTMRPPPEAGSL